MNKLSINMDLTPTSFEEAILQYRLKYQTKPTCLIVSQSLLPIAFRVLSKAQHDYIVDDQFFISGAALPPNTWMVSGQEGIFWTEGA
jgi:hypothetical protein